MVLFVQSSKQSKLLLRLLTHRKPTVQSTGPYRTLITERDSPLQKQPLPPLPPRDEDSIVTQVVQLLQPRESEWNFDQLRQLLLNESPLSPDRLFRIIRLLPSSDKALKFFEYVHENSPVEDPSSLSNALQAIVELAGRVPGSKQKLIELYGMSKERKIPLTTHAAAILVRYFGSAGMVEESVSVYNELGSSLKNTHVRNVFIDELLRSGRLDDALKVLDEMFEPNAEAPPNTATARIVMQVLLNRESPGRRVNDEEIAKVFLKFCENGVNLGDAWLTRLITKICKGRRLTLAWDVLHEAMKVGKIVEVGSCNALLTWLGMGPDFNRMNRLMAEMKELAIMPDVITFGILIKQLCKSRLVDDAIEVFQQLGQDEEKGGISIKPDVIMYNTLIDGLCKVGREEEALNLKERMQLESNCKPTTITYNCLMDGFCKAGRIEKAEELLKEMNDQGVPLTVISVNTLVNGMCRHGRIHSAVEFVEEMRQKGIEGNAITYTTLINAYCNVNNIDKAMEFFDQMLRTECSLDVVVYYTLITGLTKAGRMDDATFVLSKLKEADFCPDVICYNTLIGGFCRKNKLDKAYEMLKEMEDAGMKPDSVTYNTLISHLSKQGNFNTAHRVMKNMVNEGLTPNVATYGSLIHAYCLHEHIDEAMKIFREISSTSKITLNTVIYNILIESFCKNGKVDHAISLMDDMKVKGVRPNTTTYNAMFKGLRENNMFAKACELMNQMIVQACKPDYITIEVLTAWLSAVGETEKLKRFLQGLKISGSTA